MELFKDKDMPLELIQTLEGIGKEREAAIIAFTIASKTIQKCDERFWELIVLAMPEYKEYYVHVNIETGKIHAESGK